MMMWIMGTYLISPLLEYNAYLAMEVLFFPIDLSFIVITTFATTRLIVVCLLCAADCAFPGWDPGSGVRFLSSRRQCRHKPRFDPSQHTQRRR